MTKKFRCVKFCFFFIFLILYCYSLVANNIVVESAKVDRYGASFEENDLKSQTVYGKNNSKYSTPSDQLETELMTNLSNKVNDLVQQVLKLRGKTDELEHQIEQLKLENKKLYHDVDKRFSDILKLPKPKILNKGIETDTENESISDYNENKSELQDYQSIFNLIEKQKFEKASLALQAFISSFPNSKYIENAWYWLGEISNVLGQTQQSKNAFLYIINQYPKGSKIADSLYKLGVIEAETKNITQSKKYFHQVITQYPNSTAADLSKNYLKTLK